MRTTDRNALARYCHTLAEYWKVTRQLVLAQPTKFLRDMTVSHLAAIETMTCKKVRLIVHSL